MRARALAALALVFAFVPSGSATTLRNGHFTYDEYNDCFYDATQGAENWSVQIWQADGTLFRAAGIYNPGGVPGAGGMCWDMRPRCWPPEELRLVMHYQDPLDGTWVKVQDTTQTCLLGTGQ